MQTDSGIEQLLARAILDLELKMKHEMRQNSALQLAKIEKHSQHMEKRLGIVEAKLEALLSRDNNSSSGGMGGPNNHHLHYRGGNRQYQAGSVNRQTSYYSRTANLTNSHQSDRQIARTTTPASRTYQHYGMFGSQNNTPQHHRQHFSLGGNERKQQRPKQMVGTGGNKAQIVQQEKPSLIANATWTTKLGGVYTSGEEDSGEETKTRSGSESCYSVAKPAPKCGEILSANEEEKPSNKGQYSDEDEGEEGEIIDDENKQKGMEEQKQPNAEALTEMVLEEEEVTTTKTAISNFTLKSLEEEIDHGKKKVDDEDLNESGSNDNGNQLSFNTAKESDSFYHATTKQQKHNVIALPLHDYEYPMMAATTLHNSVTLTKIDDKIVETKEERKKEKMTTIVATAGIAQTSTTPAQTIGGFGRGRRN